MEMPATKRVSGTVQAQRNLERIRKSTSVTLVPTWNGNGAIGLCGKLREGVADLELGVLYTEVEGGSTGVARLNESGKAHLVKAQGVDAARERSRSVGAVCAGAISWEGGRNNCASRPAVQRVVRHKRHCRHGCNEYSGGNGEQGGWCEGGHD